MTFPHCSNFDPNHDDFFLCKRLEYDGFVQIEIHHKMQNKKMPQFWIAKRWVIMEMVLIKLQNQNFQTPLQKSDLHLSRYDINGFKILFQIMSQSCAPQNGLRQRKTSTRDTKKHIITNILSFNTQSSRERWK